MRVFQTLKMIFQGVGANARASKRKRTKTKSATKIRRPRQNTERSAKKITNRSVFLKEDTETWGKGGMGVATETNRVDYFFAEWGEPSVPIPCAHLVAPRIRVDGENECDDHERGKDERRGPRERDEREEGGDDGHLDRDCARVRGGAGRRKKATEKHTRARQGW